MSAGASIRGPGDTPWLRPKGQDAPADLRLALERMDLTAINPELELFASNLKSARAAAGLSQRELGERSRLDRTYVSNLERGIGNPSLLKINAIARVLGVTPASLIMPPSG